MCSTCSEVKCISNKYRNKLISILRLFLFLHAYNIIEACLAKVHMTFKEHISDIDGLIKNSKINFYLNSFQIEHKAAVPKIRSVFIRNFSFRQYMSNIIFILFSIQGRSYLRN